MTDAQNRIAGRGSMIGIEDTRIAAQNVRPSDITAYVDRIQVWLTAPLSKADRHSLEQHCRNRVDYRVRRAKWDRRRRYRYRLQLRPRGPAALSFLGMLPGVHINQAEVALDWTFDHERDRDEAYA